MKAEQFIKYYRPEMSEYCPVVICPDGNIFDSSAGHLQTLISLCHDPDILCTIPKDVSPLLYLAAHKRAVIVDYENQIYMEKLTEEQEDALHQLIDAKLIADHQIRMTHEKAKI